MRAKVWFRPQPCAGNAQPPHAAPKAPSRMDFGAKQERPTPCPRMCGVKRRPFICFSWLFCLLPSSFLALMQEKKQKKIKASGTPAKFGGVPDGGRLFWEPSAILEVPGQTSPPSAFLALMQEKKQKKIKASGTPANLVGYPMEPAILEPFGYSRCTRPNFPALGRGPFLVLIEEKRQKKIKASGTPAKFGGVPDGAGHFGNLRLFSMYLAKLPRPRLRAFNH